MSDAESEKMADLVALRAAVDEVIAPRHAACITCSSYSTGIATYRDETSTSRDRRERSSACDVVAVLDAAGHNLHLDRPPLVAALLADWLDRVRAG